MNSDFTLSAFAEPVTALADTPNLPAAELKRRFQAPADELRLAHNALAQCVAGITDATYPETVSESMLDGALAAKLNGKAEQSALEAAKNTTADRLTAMQTTVETLQTQLAQKCSVAFGAFTGNGASQTITLGFCPRAVLVTSNCGLANYSGIALQGHPLRDNQIVITNTGFTVTYVNNRDSINFKDVDCRYLAFQA